MHSLRWAGIFLLIILVVTLLDTAARVSLNGDVTVQQLSNNESDTLIVYEPGLLADGEWSARQLTDTWRDFGDVWLVNPTGDRFEYEQQAQEVAADLEADTHKRVVFIGSSLGAHSALDVMSLLSKDKLARTTFSLLAVCSPGKGANDIKQPLKFVSNAAVVFRLGPVTNATWGKLYTRMITGKQPRTFAMTYYIDQVNYVRSRPAPDQDLLAQFDVIYLQATNDELVSSSAATAWTTPENVREVNSKHVAYDADPEEWNAAFEAALSELAGR